MSKKDIKNQNYREVPPKHENEPEEGEIIDEYDLIVSSDEELSMRQRILQLEAENEEIEQIAVISRSYVDKIKNNRAAQVPTDVSSISSTEFVTPQKRKRKRSNERKKKRHCHRQHPREHNIQHDQTLRYDGQKLSQKTHSKKAHCKRRQKLFAKKHKNIQSERSIHYDLNAGTLSLESLETSDSSCITDTENTGYNWFMAKRRENELKKEKSITRKTLRMAVARNTDESNSISNKYCLKDKLLRQDLVGQCLKNDEYKYVEELVIRDDDDDDVQVIENEPIIQTIDEDSTDSMEEKELRLIALKSAVLKKHMARKMRNAEVAYSPTDFDEMLSSNVLYPDNKMEDIDIIDLEAEDFQPACITVSPEASPQLQILDDQEESQQMVDCKPVDMDIANSDSEDATIDSWSKDADPPPDSFDFSKSIQFGYYMQNLHELPPPPPGVDDYDEVPPPPPYHMHFNSNIQDMDVDNEDLTESQQRMVDPEIYTAEHKQIEFEPKTTDCPIQIEAEEDEDEEEEEALRALLLSKLQSPKNQKNPLKQKNSNEKNLLKINDTGQNQCKPKPTEIILKEAVKRLKIHSQIEACKEETIVKDFVEENTKINDEAHENSENSKEQYSFEKLIRDRLNLYKNSNPSNTDQSQENTVELPSESCSERNNDNTATQNSFEMPNTIDISDITRRLQIIKENVLNCRSQFATNCNSIPMEVMEDPISFPNENTEIPQNVQELNEQKLCQLSQPNSENFVNAETADDLKALTTRDKTVEANFDINTKQTTFKVTIKNNAAVNSEENNIGKKLKNCHKEDEIHVPKILPLKIIGNTPEKDLNREKRIVKITNKVTQTNLLNTPQVNGFATDAQTPIGDKTSSNSTYSLLRATKIIKPNKIINKNFDLKPKPIPKVSEPALITKSLKTESNSKSTDSPRLITSMDQVKYMCKIPPFIISLQNSCNESSEEEMFGDYNSLYKPLYDYNDNASPLSLNLETPSTTPLRSNSPIDANGDGGGIEKSNVESLHLTTKETPKPREKIFVDKIPTSDKLNKTPLAVRHLPAAAQSEYRKLVHRMKLLENKRKLTNTEENKKENIANEQNDSTSLPHSDEVNQEKVKLEAKKSLVKKVLIKNANNKNATSTIPNKACKLNKSNVLRSYENLYIKVGEGIVNNLDKSLKLVEEAKRAKIAKIKLETRLKELKAEMDILQSQHKEEQQKISRIYPSICSTNDVITSLKQKRSKVYKAAMNLGKTTQGDVYRLSNDLKEIITTKSKKLATEIKTVNSLKAQNIKNIEDLMNQKPFKVVQPEVEENKFKNVQEDCQANIQEIEVSKTTSANSEIIVCSKNDELKEKEEENTPETTFKSDMGGNTEFQKMETDDSVSHKKNTEDSCSVEPNGKLNKTSVDLDGEKKAPISSYISPLEHLRNFNSNMDPNGVVCPYDLMGNCEDVACKYVHLTPNAKT